MSLKNNIRPHSYLPEVSTQLYPSFVYDYLPYNYYKYIAIEWCLDCSYDELAKFLQF